MLDKLHVSDESLKRPLCKAAKDIFGKPFQLSKVGTLFECAVDMTLVSRSHSVTDAKNVFGVSGTLLADSMRLTVRRGKEYDDMRNCPPNELYLPANKDEEGNAKDQRGFDSRVTLHPISKIQLPGVPDAVFVYIQEKIALSPRTPAEKVYARMYTNVLAEHMKLLPKLKPDDLVVALENVHIVMYNWGDMGENAPTSAAVKSSLEKVLDKATARNLDEFKFADRVFHDHFNSNVHTVAQPKLEEWLIPSLRIIPRLVEEIESTSLD